MAKEEEKLCFACPGRYPAAYSSCPRCQLPLVFEKIGKVWRVEGLIGRGGMGAVFAAHHVDDRRKRAAVKVLVPVAGEQKVDRAERISRFQREAAAMERLTHENVVQLYDFARERDGSLYLAMEFLEGPTLAKVLKERGPLPASEAIELIVPVLSALEASHKVGVIHRDLKPDNIVLAAMVDGKKSFDRVKVVDFGVARLKGDSFTDAGQALGTPVYMAPEQAQGGDIDERVDVYGAGAVLYELLSGKPPFVPPDVPNANLAVLAQIMTTDAEPLSSRCPAVARGLESVVMRALCRDREQRFRSAADFVTALRLAQERPDEVQWTWQRPESGFEIALPPAVAAVASSSRSLPGSAASRSSQGLPPVLRQSIPPVLRQSMSPLSRRSIPPAAPLSPLSPLNSGPNRSGMMAPVTPGLGASGVSSPSSPASASPASASSLDPGRSHGAMAPVGGSSASALSGTFAKRGISLGYKLLIAGIYLVVVSVIVVSLLLDRNSCKPRPSSTPGFVPTGSSGR